MSNLAFVEINWEEFWEKFDGPFCTANEAQKRAQNFALTSARPIEFVAAISLWGMSAMMYVMFLWTTVSH